MSQCSYWNRQEESPLKRYLLTAINDLSEDERKPSDSNSTDWVSMVDRGGLFCINDIT